MLFSGVYDIQKTFPFPTEDEDNTTTEADAYKVDALPTPPSHHHLASRLPPPPPPPPPLTHCPRPWRTCCLSPQGEDGPWVGAYPNQFVSWFESLGDLMTSVTFLAPLCIGLNKYRVAPNTTWQPASGVVGQKDSQVIAGTGKPISYHLPLTHALAATQRCPLPLTQPPASTQR